MICWTLAEMPGSGRLFHSLCFVMNYDVVDAGGAEGEAVVWMEGDGFQLGAVDFGGGGGWGGEIGRAHV